MKYGNNQTFISNFKINYHIIIKFFLFFFVINIISAKEIYRPDLDKHKVIETIIKMLHTNFGKNNIVYKESFSDYNISMTFLNLYVQPEEIIVNEEKDQFVSLIKPIIDFILNITITNNNDIANTPNNKVSIIFNHNINNPVINFKLDDMFAQIKPNYIEFQRNVDNSYRYKFFNYVEEFAKNVEIKLNLDSCKYIPKIYDLLKKNENKMKMFLFNSFCSYLDDILNVYPEPDGVFLYNKIVDNILSVKTFSLSNITENSSLEKIYFNRFKEEKFIKISTHIKIINLQIDFDLIFDEGKRTENYKETIPEISIIYTFIHFPVNDTEIANTTLNTIIKSIFDIIIENYIQ